MTERLPSTGSETLLCAAGVARRLGRSRAWFFAHRTELEAKGFPKPLAVVGRWDPAAIDRWVAGESKLEAAALKQTQKRALDAAFGL